MVRMQGDEREGPQGVPQWREAALQDRGFDRYHQRGREGVPVLPLRVRMPPELQATLPLEPLPHLGVLVHPRYCNNYAACRKAVPEMAQMLGEARNRTSGKPVAEDRGPTCTHSPESWPTTPVGMLLLPTSCALLVGRPERAWGGRTSKKPGLGRRRRWWRCGGGWTCRRGWRPTPSGTPGSATCAATRKRSSPVGWRCTELKGRPEHAGATAGGKSFAPPARGTPPAIDRCGRPLYYRRAPETSKGRGCSWNSSCTTPKAERHL